MRDAQMKAVSRRLDYRVNFNVAPNTYVLERDSGGFNPDGPLQTAPSGVTIDITGLPGGTATFRTDSTCPNGGNITLSYQKGGIIQAQKGISLRAATGRIIIQ
jgi:hypothetical protein